MTKACNALLLSVLLLASACATAGSDRVNLNEPKRVLGREENVRIDAQLYAEVVSPNSNVRIVYEVENERDQPIAIAELLPDATYDRDSQTITVNLGSEVPGNSMLPRLVKLAPGEKRSFAAGVRMPAIPASLMPNQGRPSLLRVKLHFLGDVTPFGALVGIPERVIQNKELADRLFLTWVESSQSVVTNTIPIEWMTPAAAGIDAATSPTTGGRRRGRRG